MKHKTNRKTIQREAMMKLHEADQGHTYRIKIKENLDPGVMDWFSGLTLIPLENGGTVLVGPFPDQPALRGFLDQLWNLNFTVLSVDVVTNENDRISDA
jgi:hypothetical protein